MDLTGFFLVGSDTDDDNEVCVVLLLHRVTGSIGKGKRQASSVNISSDLRSMVAKQLRLTCIDPMGSDHHRLISVAADCVASVPMPNHLRLTSLAHLHYRFS